MRVRIIIEQENGEYRVHPTTYASRLVARSQAERIAQQLAGTVIEDRDGDYVVLRAEVAEVER